MQNQQSLKDFIQQVQEEEMLATNMEAEGFDPNSLTEDDFIDISDAEMEALLEEADRLQAIGTPEALAQLEMLLG